MRNWLVPWVKPVNVIVACVLSVRLTSTDAYGPGKPLMALLPVPSKIEITSAPAVPAQASSATPNKALIFIDDSPHVYSSARNPAHCASFCNLYATGATTLISHRKYAPCRCHEALL